MWFRQTGPPRQRRSGCLVCFSPVGWNGLGDDVVGAFSYGFLRWSSRAISSRAEHEQRGDQIAATRLPSIFLHAGGDSFRCQKACAEGSVPPFRRHVTADDPSSTQSMHQGKAQPTDRKNPRGKPPGVHPSQRMTDSGTRASGMPELQTGTSPVGKVTSAASRDRATKLCRCTERVGSRVREGEVERCDRRNRAYKVAVWECSTKVEADTRRLKPAPGPPPGSSIRRRRCLPAEVLRRW